MLQNACKLKNLCVGRLKYDIQEVNTKYVITTHFLKKMFQSGADSQRKADQ